MNRCAHPQIPSLLALPLAVAGLLLGAAVCAAQPAPAAAGGRAATVEQLGTVDFAATGSPEARRWFERGVAALHSFWYEEAREAFRRAREIDPDLYMAYWGEAMTHNHPVWDRVELDEGRAALAALAPTPEARSARAPSERERAWMAAVEILFPSEGGDDDSEKAARDAAYAEAMERLAEAHPDVEARVFHALALQGVVYGGVEEARRFPVLMRSAAGLEELLDEHPDHPGVLHYLIHAYDDPTHAPLGLRAARTYARVAPAAHHALHMPSHIFVQLGRWPEASSSNENAWASSVAWVEQRDLAPGRRDFHSLSWLLYSYLQEGRREKAAQTLEVARAAVSQGSGERAEHARTDMEARYLIETESAAPVSLLDGDGADSRTALAVALAAHRAGDREALARAAEWAASSEDHEDGHGGSGGAEGSAAEVRAKEVAGLLALADGRPEEALAILEEAVALEDALGPPSGPPEAVKPAHELLGEVLLGLDRPREAREAFEESLRRTPRRARSLLGAARAAGAAGDGEAAAAHYRELLRVWERADPGLPEAEEARAYLGEAAG